MSQNKDFRNDKNLIVNSTAALQLNGRQNGLFRKILNATQTGYELPKAATEPTKNSLILKAEEFRKTLMPVIERMCLEKADAEPFQQSIKLKSSGTVENFHNLQSALDLSTIKRKLNNFQYSDPWEFVDDMWQIFDNAWLSNKEISHVYRCATRLAKVFEATIDPVMKSLGYCCGKHHKYSTQVLCCDGEPLCTISRDKIYYSFTNDSNNLLWTEYAFCQKCFHAISGVTVTLGDNPMSQIIIKKDDFVNKKNNYQHLEPFVNCFECGRKYHQVCVLYLQCIWPDGYFCKICLQNTSKERQENIYNAKTLPSCKLSDFIEARVNESLRLMNGHSEGKVHIRILSDCDKISEVKPQMQSRFIKEDNLKSGFPYRAKALFAFQELDDIDVCFFGMHVQEYGSECPSPNTRRVYISYLDSVNFFEPRKHRTVVYQEILLGYLAYVKQLGYITAHIWSCPPFQGDDYIFYSHPPDQKMPSPEHLQNWYTTLLEKGQRQGDIFGFTDIHQQLIDENLTSALNIPYFEGDFWTTFLEKNIDKFERARNIKFKKKSPENENTIKTHILAALQEHKDSFFVIRLQPTHSAGALAAIKDPDPLIKCDLMNGRDGFLALCYAEHYEYSSLRRAKFSTMCMLYKLHNHNGNGFEPIFICDICKTEITMRYHCSVCDNFDLCSNCKTNIGHDHHMAKIGFNSDDELLNDLKEDKLHEARKQLIERCIQSLVHAYDCRDQQCKSKSCLKMKRSLDHTKSCKTKIVGGCATCKKFIALCCYHAKYCTEVNCMVPFCENIKRKITQQESGFRIKQAGPLSRQMYTINTTVKPAKAQPPAIIQ